MGCCSKKNKEKSAPVPWIKLLVVALVVFGTQFGSLMIFPFLPFMVQDFFPGLHRKEIGRYAGFLGSAYFLGNFCGSLLWGWIADRWGRKPSLLFGMFGNIVSLLLFGTSQNFGWAVSTRFLWGFLNGNIGIAKTYVSEICDDNSMARGMSILSLSGASGRLFGSVVGGLLAQPADKYEVLRVPFFCLFPYLLPCLVGLGFCVLAMLAAMVFLKETLQEKKSCCKKKKKVTSLEEEERLLEMEEFDSGAETDFLDDSVGETSFEDVPMLNGSCHSTDTNTVTLHSNSQNSNSILDSDLESDTENEDLPDSDTSMLILDDSPDTVKDRRPQQDGFTNVPSSEKKRSKLKVFLKKFQRGCCEMVKDRRIMLSTSLYGGAALIQVMGQELYPLLMVNDHAYGGFQMDAAEISVILSIASSFQFFWQLLVYPYLARRIGIRWMYRLAVITIGVTLVILPFANAITGPITAPSNNSNVTSRLSYCNRNYTDAVLHSDSLARLPASVWIVLIVIFGVNIVGRTTSFTSVNIMMGNSAERSNRGMVNGYGQSLAAFARTAGPTVASLVFAWSEVNGLGWPLNYHFMFGIIGALSFVIFIPSFLLPKSIEKRRTSDVS